MAGNLGLALAQNLDQVADAHFATSDEIQQAQACSVDKGGKQGNEIRRSGPNTHESIIYGLTDMSISRYIRVDVYEESHHG